MSVDGHQRIHCVCTRESCINQTGQYLAFYSVALPFIHPSTQQTVLFWYWLYGVFSWDGFGMISRGMKNSRNATIHPSCRWRQRRATFRLPPSCGPVVEENVLQQAPGSGDSLSPTRSLHHTAPPPYPTPSARSLSLSLYIQARLPGKRMGWNTDCDSRQAHASNLANVWMRKGFSVESVCPQGSHVDSNTVVKVQDSRSRHILGVTGELDFPFFSYSIQTLCSFFKTNVYSPP